MKTHEPNTKASGAAGFSLMELMVALGITLGIMVIAAQLLAQSLGVRARENARVEAIGDVQRALQVMSREVANAGLGLDGANGIVADDSEDQQLRIIANLNAFTESPGDLLDSDEDVVFTIINNNTGGEPQRLITRQDVNSGQVTSLANRVDELDFDYLAADGTATTPDQAVKVRITVSVTLPAVGTQGSGGYQPASRVRLVSEATLRNQMLRK
ncbi:MAG TPA: hypothetical protein VD968_01235 [Pyrinomonadaceae bacterium]|nr:hypothetical protein [Pyrinomonadaceae bacterium]